MVVSQLIQSYDSVIYSVIYSVIFRDTINAHIYWIGRGKRQTPPLVDDDC